MFCNQTQNLLFKNFIFPKTNVRKCKNSPPRPPPTKKSPVKFQYSSFRLRPTNRCLLQLGKYKGEGNVLLFYLNVRPFLKFDHFKVSQSSTFIKFHLLKVRVKVMIKKHIRTGIFRYVWTQTPKVGPGLGFRLGLTGLIGVPNGLMQRFSN